MALPLVTARLVLRPFTEADVDAIHRVYGDPEAMRLVGEGRPTDLAGTRTMVRALALPEHRASLRVLEKLGFQRAGTRFAYGREHVFLRLPARAAC